MRTPLDLQPDMTMQQLLDVYPGAQRAMFAKYHIGGCSACGFQPDETLAGVCKRNEDLPVTDVIAFLHTSREDDLANMVVPLELKQLLDNGGAVRVLDIRTREEFEAANIPGSTLFTQEMMTDIMGGWDKQELIVLVDHDGMRGLDGAAYFAGHGFANIKALAGGIDAYSREADSSIPRYRAD